MELKRKLRIMEESYDRLMFMFQKQQTEIKDKTLAFKIQVETATESYRVAKKENEKLKEANDIQQKLWKIFLDKFEKDEAVKKDGGLILNKQNLKILSQEKMQVKILKMIVKI